MSACAGIELKGVFFAIQKAAPLLAKGASVVVTTSFLNEVGAPGLSILSATKAAVRSMVRTLGAEFAARGIRVNAVSPGPTSTPFHGKLGLSEKQLNEAASAIEDQVPLHRFGEPGEIAKAALFLASEDSSFMTGSNWSSMAEYRSFDFLGATRRRRPRIGRRLSIPIQRLLISNISLGSAFGKLRLSILGSPDFMRTFQRIGSTH